MTNSMSSKGSLVTGDERVEEVPGKGPPEYTHRVNAGIQYRMRLTSSPSPVAAIIVKRSDEK